MILYDRSSFRDFILRVRGSAVVDSLPEVLLCVIYSSLVVWWYEQLDLNIPKVNKELKMIMVVTTLMLTMRAADAYSRYKRGFAALTEMALSVEVELGLATSMRAHIIGLWNSPLERMCFTASQPSLDHVPR